MKKFILLALLVIGTTEAKAASTYCVCTYTEGKWESTLSYWATSATNPVPSQEVIGTYDYDNRPAGAQCNAHLDALIASGICPQNSQKIPKPVCESLMHLHSKIQKAYRAAGECR